LRRRQYAIDVLEGEEVRNTKTVLDGEEGMTYK
jgi:hypothetical protein